MNTPKHYPSGTSISAIVSDQQRRSNAVLMRGKIKMAVTIIIALVLLFGYPVAALVMWLMHVIGVR